MANITNLSNRGLSEGTGSQVGTFIPKEKLFNLYTQTLAEAHQIRDQMKSVAPSEPQFKALKARYDSAQQRLVGLQVLVDKHGWANDLKKYAGIQLAHVYNVGSRQPTSLTRSTSATMDSLRQKYVNDPVRWTTALQEGEQAMSEGTQSNQQTLPTISPQLQGTVQLNNSGAQMVSGMNADFARLANSQPARLNLMPPGAGRDSVDFLNIFVVNGLAAGMTWAVNKMAQGHNFFAPTTPAHEMHFQQHYFKTVTGNE